MMKPLKQNEMMANEKNDQKISVALMASFVILTIQYFILVYFNLFSTSTVAGIQLLSKILVGAAFLYALPAVLRRGQLKLVTVYFFAIVIFLLHYAIFPENRTYIVGLLFSVFLISLPTFIYSLSIQDYSVLKVTMKKASYIVFGFGLLIGALILSGKISLGAYSMPLSYYMLLPAIMFIDELLDKFSLRSLLFTILSLLIILVLGSRGAILCIAVFIVLKFFRLYQKQTYKKVLGYFGFVGILTGIFLFFPKIILYIYNGLLAYGINSRTLFLFLKDGFYLSGRDRIYEKMIDEIVAHPILGIGIAGDRLLFSDSYAHNLFLEILANFGLLMGGIILIVLIVILIRALRTKDLEKYHMMIIYLGEPWVCAFNDKQFLFDGYEILDLLGVSIRIMRKSKVAAPYKNKEEKP